MENLLNDSKEDSYEFPEYCFMGVDGNYYFIGHTPHGFILQLGDLNGNFTDIDRKAIDLWIFEHLRYVEMQRDLTLEASQALYFEKDIPFILGMIFDRLMESQEAYVQSAQVIESRTKEITRKLAEAKDGNQAKAQSRHQRGDLSKPKRKSPKSI